MAAPSPEHSIGLPKGPETAPSVVSQPVKIESALGEQLGQFLEGINRVSEVASSGAGEQGGTGQTQTSGGAVQTQSSTMTARQQAIAAIPAQPVMQKELEKHIRAEVKNLRKQAQQIARMNKPGAAYHLNILYRRIRHLNSLLSEILSASYDVLKKLFIRVFIDRQAIL